MPYKSLNWEKMRIAKSPGCKREEKVLESEDFKGCVVSPKWAITDQVMEYAAWGPPRVENLIVYAKSPVRDFETRKKKWEEKLEALWKETGYALRPKAHIASKREIEKNNAWDAYIGAYNAAVVAQRYAGKAYVVLTWDADILGTGKDPEVIERLLNPDPSSDRVRLKGLW